ncbi:gluconate 2-dehydrogenase subunit 3 family protein [Thalassotalea atypica]|uniref:gluconate 2-dehydrogenase subunit 3 family protein n=1 Tax=Thalassotalea atypica TaxID=2054316 RepID=UPI0025727FAF|nr:gluconate 2-dehydrogenase subunit 3 family protein [Thalassotalea atypica]
MSFFDKKYQTPRWMSKKLSRRKLLKSAAGAGTIAAMPSLVIAQSTVSKFQSDLAKNPWLTLDAVLAHLLPSSASGPGANELNATLYLYNVVTEQTIDQEEKTFILKGVGWLNGYSESQLKKSFIALNDAERETMLRGISGSRAGSNWLNTLINYLFEAMLSPPSYGGNPDGIGWQWLEHQAGFPLPPVGKRYFELPGNHQISIKNLTVEAKRKA